MKVPQLDLRAQYESLREPILEGVERLFSSQRFVLGQTVADFEQAMAEYLAAPVCVGMSSGSEALRVALAILDIGPGDEVLLPAYTFFATAGAVAHAGARPVFVDVGDDFLIDMEDLRRALPPRSGAVIAVHLFGLQVPWGPLRALAEERGLLLIEDAAQSIGSRRPEGRSGSLGDAAAFSFFPSKNLGGAGDGGLLCCRDEQLGERALRYRNHGEASRYHHEEVGINGRLDAIQAAVLQVKLPHLDGWNRRRRERARRYDALLADLGLEEWIRRPALPEAEEHVFHQYTLRAEGRDELLAHLMDCGIGAAVYYPLPLHRQPCFAGLPGNEGQLPVSERLAREAISLPIYPELTGEQQEQVTASIAAFYRD